MTELAINEVIEPSSEFLKFLGYIFASLIGVTISAVIAAWAYHYFKKKRSLADKVNGVMERLSEILKDVEILVNDFKNQEKSIDRRFTDLEKKIDEGKKENMNKIINAKQKVEDYHKCVKALQERVAIIETEHKNCQKK